MKLDSKTTEQVKEVESKVKTTGVKTKLTLEDKIKEWKKTYSKLYKNEFEDKTIIWKILSRKDFKDVLNMSDELSQEDRLLTKQEITTLKSVLYPENIAELIEQNAGLATTLSEEILSKSGFELSETEAL